MIHLYLVRHGAAVEDGASDALRPLTNKARKRFHKLARSLTQSGEKLDLILTSPLVRAVQTAEILASEVRHGEVAVVAELAPGHAVEAVLRAVAGRAGKLRSVALVGHEPQLSSLVSLLAHLSPAQSSNLDMKSGMVMRIDVSGLPAAKTAEPRWWLKPRSGARKKGLPLQEPAAKTTASGRSAGKKPVQASAPQKPAKKKQKPAKKKASAARPRAAARKTSTRPIAAPRQAAKAKPRAAQPAAQTKPPVARPAPRKPPSPPKPAAARKEALPPERVSQKFMGSPRPASPPPAAAPPTTPAAAAPVQAPAGETQPEEP